MSSQVHHATSTTCLRVVTSTVPEINPAGFLNVFVNSGGENGFERATPIGQYGFYYNTGEDVLEQCYDEIIGVQVQNGHPNGWAGSIETSVHGSTYSPMVCQDNCTPIGGATTSIGVDGDSDYFGVQVKCLNGEACTLVLESTQSQIINLARQEGAVASQSTTYEDHGGVAAASRAIDGNTNGDYYGDGGLSVSHTLPGETSPWWMVDLAPGYSYAITSVKIHNRDNDGTGDGANALTNSVVEVQLQDASGNILASRPLPVGEVKAVYDLNFGSFVGQVRSVKIQKLDASPPTPLMLAEVEVYGWALTQSPTEAPTDTPTDSPTDTPTDTPTDSPTDTPTDTPTDSPTDTPTDSPTNTIKSWDLELTSVSSNFTKDSGDEIALNYKIGKDRDYEVFMLNEDCSTSITEGVVSQSSSTSDIEGDTSNSNLLVSVDIVKSSIATSNIWVDGKVKLCAKVHLKSSESGSVMKKLDRVIEVALDFENNFQTIEDANFAQITLGSNETEAAVNDYIQACTCDGNNASFVCNTNILGVDDYLNVCLESLDSEMKINNLYSLKMVQGDTTLDIVSDNGLVDGSISSKSKVATQNGVHVASVIPASFFSYESSGTAEVSGVVFLKLSGSRRRLAVEIDRALQSDGDQESAFTMEVQLKKNELDVADDSNGAINAVVTGLIAGPAAVVTAAATYLMW